MQENIDRELESWQRDFVKRRNVFTFIRYRLTDAIRNCNYNEFRRWNTIAGERTTAFYRLCCRYDLWKEIREQAISSDNTDKAKEECIEDTNNITRLRAYGTYW